ncbi:unnamed protein product [Caenorhabditis auriculariae]|uniref:Uncharacterized protein n=1 Tax=Caenorhabditis auriculariae TaxID=2777116 RepID=A0A8S1HZX7_9PELO|nr:unnamed protein product [Caenorhabditis auriculariae]
MPEASYQSLDLRLHCTLELEVEASDSDSTACLLHRTVESEGGPEWQQEPREESPAAALTLPEKNQSVRFDAALGVRRRPASIPARVSTGIHPVTSFDLKTSSPLVPSSLVLKPSQTVATRIGYKAFIFVVLKHRFTC